MVGKGWISLYRKLQDSNMYKSLTSKQRDVLIQCLLMANHSENEWEFDGEIYKCKPGQFITSLESLVKNCAKDVSIQNVRTSINKLVKWGFLTNQSTSTGRLITVINWTKYQGREGRVNKESNKGSTESKQLTSRELTTNNNGNNIENEKNDNKPNVLPQKKHRIIDKIEKTKNLSKLKNKLTYLEAKELDDRYNWEALQVTIMIADNNISINSNAKVFNILNGFSDNSALR